MAGVYASLSSLAKVPQGQQRVSNARSEARYLLHGLPRLRSSPLSCNAAAQATSAFAAAAPTAAAVLEQQPGLSLLHHPDQLELLKQQLETKLHRPASPGSSSSTGSTLHVTTIQDSPAPAATEPIHRWGDGSGLTVEQFKAALQSLPMQQRVRWKSVYPAIGSGARGQVFQAVNLDTGACCAAQPFRQAVWTGCGHASWGGGLSSVQVIGARYAKQSTWAQSHNSYNIAGIFIIMSCHVLRIMQSQPANGEPPRPLGAGA